MFKRLILATAIALFPTMLATPVMTVAYAHDEWIATRGECDVGVNAFFHASQYCAYIEDVTSIGNQFAVRVFLDHNNADWWNDYLVDCGDGWVAKVTPPKRKNNTAQANAFDRALWRQIC